jgi:hypothetical protein
MRVACSGIHVKIQLELVYRKRIHFIAGKIVRRIPVIMRFRQKVEPGFEIHREFINIFTDFLGLHCMRSIQLPAGVCFPGFGMAETTSDDPENIRVNGIVSCYGYHLIIGIVEEAVFSVCTCEHGFSTLHSKVIRLKHICGIAVKAVK